MKEFTVSGIVGGFRIETKVRATSLHHAIRVFESMHHDARNVYVLN